MKTLQFLTPEGTRFNAWWQKLFIGDLGLIFHQTVGWNESDLLLMIEKQQTNPPVASSAWKVPVDRQSPTRLERRWPSWTKHLAKKNTGNKMVSASGKNIEHDQRTWELKSEIVSLLAVTPTLSSTPTSTLKKVSICTLHVNQVSKTQVRFLGQWLKWDFIIDGPSYQREEVLQSDVLSGPLC